ncbi:glutamate--cysteine ligase [Streptomyces sp. Je 1-369]|uniref:glutamate--cysteine ligase n=1 Tax=Streptomyces sp. Je 1-369 TaxID=2966192 RepID=UPI0022866530|nr:glutamate--cysteine ligase [Streptomyces sp. Je 1-369]WAL99774.1 glutamate--cysteine ligase [Streptomyces sp. Je 1-369]
MGRELRQTVFTDQDHQLFRTRLQQSLGVLGDTVTRSSFGLPQPMLGAELEMFLADPDDGRPVPRNEEVRLAAADPRLVLEVNRYNLEGNLTPVPVRGSPFTALHQETRDLLSAVAKAALPHGAVPYCSGILSTLRPGDLTRHNVSAKRRYGVLDDALGRVPRYLNVRGEQSCRLRSDTLCAQGAVSSWQIHLTVPAVDFARYYNAAQLVIAPVLAVCANSPVLLGRLLWDETRIPWYEQTFGTYRTGSSGPGERTGFGEGWVRDGVGELMEAACRHRPLVPICADIPPTQTTWGGGPAELEELRLHVGTVWWWNRPVYDPTGDGHLRIEMRALPSGPTPVDMAANTALLIGLVLDHAAAHEPVVPPLPFAHARANFYAAARQGLDATLWWPRAGSAPVQRTAHDVVGSLLGRAARGLAGAGVTDDEIQRWLGIIEARVASGRSPAHWHRRARRAGACDREIFRHSLELASEDVPVHAWTVPGAVR